MGNTAIASNNYEESESESCLVVSDSLQPHGLYSPWNSPQARILECVAVPFSRGSSQPKDQASVLCIAGRFFTSRATRETRNKMYSD